MNYTRRIDYSIKLSPVNLDGSEDQGDDDT